MVRWLLPRPFRFRKFGSCDLIDAYKENLKEKLNKILSANTGQPYEVVAADTERDNWKTAEEAKEYGLIDTVITSRAEVNSDGEK